MVCESAGFAGAGAETERGGARCSTRIRAQYAAKRAGPLGTQTGRQRPDDNVGKTESSLVVTFPSR